MIHETEIRRRDRSLSREEATALLDAGEYGILSTVGADGQPYGVPLNYVRDGETLLLHGALEGRKIEHLRNDDRVSFCVVGLAETVREKFTTRYESVIVSGRAELIEDFERKAEMLRKFCKRFAPKNKSNHAEATEKFLTKFLDQTAVILVSLESISGKAHRH